jgi:Ca-activated chloride channel homolog
MNRQLRRWAALAVLTALALIAAACTDDPAARLNQQGNDLFQQGNHQGALDRYRQAQVERSDQTAYAYNAGNALHRLGQYERALPESQRAAASGTDDIRARAYYALGNHYVRLERYREALDAYKGALKIAPGDQDAKYNLEVVQRRLDQRQQQQQQQQAQQNQAQQGQGPGQQQPNQGRPGQQQGQDPQGQQPGQGQQQGQQSGQAGGSPSQQPGQQPGQPGSTAEAEGQLRDAIAQFERTLSVEEALRILDILQQQQRARQNQAPAPQPGQLDK